MTKKGFGKKEIQKEIREYLQSTEYPLRLIGEGYKKFHVHCPNCKTCDAITSEKLEDVNKNCQFCNFPENKKKF